MAMNLHAIAAPFVAIVTGATSGLWQESMGYSTNAAGKREPVYTSHPDTDMRVQALSARELAHMDSLNIQGILRKVYLNGYVKGVDRAGTGGGDLLTFNNAVWLVRAELEAWDSGSGWCCVAVSKQMDVPA